MILVVDAINASARSNIQMEGQIMPIVGHQPSGITRRQLIVEQLKAVGIVTLADLDRWRGNRSRYSALVYLVGEQAAFWILNELAIRQCCEVAGGAANV